LLLVARFLNFFLLNFNLLIFWVIVSDHLRIMKSCNYMIYDWFGFCKTHYTFILILIEYLPSCEFFFLFLLRDFIFLFSTKYWLLFIWLINCRCFHIILIRCQTLSDNWINVKMIFVWEKKFSSFFKRWFDIDFDLYF